MSQFGHKDCSDPLYMKGFLYSLILIAGFLGGGTLSAESPAVDDDTVLSCDEFQKIFEYFHGQHLRFFLEPQTDRSALVTEAEKKLPEVLRDLGYQFLAAQYEKILLPKLLQSPTSDLNVLCSNLEASSYRAVFLKSYAKLLDPYSDFYISEELEVRSSVIDGEFVGVGIATDPGDGYLEVNHVVEDGPAANKLFIGDRIYKIDGHPVKGLGELEIRHRIRGKKGTVVTFWVQRDQNELSVSIERDKVNQRSVVAEVVDNRFLMLKVMRFYRQTPLEVEAALQSHRSKVKGVILDLRNNPGGLLQAARDLVDLFISSGVVVYLRGREVEEQVWAMNDGGYLSLPLVVLVNEGTASAAEIVAGALQDYGRALVIGQRTYGKGSVQNIYETQSTLGLNYRGGFKLTTLFYYLPSGRNVSRLDPDIVASSSGDKLEVIEHPMMPYRGPEKIAVGKIKRARHHSNNSVWSEWKLNSEDLSTRTSEEVGKTLLLRMSADIR